MSAKTFVSDVDDRWNFTYLLLKSCKGFEHLIIDFYNNRYVRSDDNGMLNESDWVLVLKVKLFLTSFYETTKIVLGVYYSTSCMVLERLYIIARIFHKYKNDHDFNEIIIAMKLKFRKYWE